MSELTFTLLRLGYLALLWVFVLTAIGLLRRDLATRAGDPGAGARSLRRKSQGGIPAAGASVGASVPSPAAHANMVTARLMGVAGPLIGRTQPLVGGSGVVIGRSAGATLVTNDDYSSSRDARVFEDHGQFFLEDLGSTNGTFIGETQVVGTVPLPVGTRFQVGRNVFELQAP